MKTVIKKAHSIIAPTKANGFIPYLLKDWSVWMVLIVAGGLFGFSQLSDMTDTFGLTALVNPPTVVTLTNDARVQNQLPMLTTNPVLEAAAKLKAQDMASNSYFAHTSPTGVTPWYWFRQAGYNFRYAGENLAVHYTESADVENAWLNSPTHRANIMNSNFTEIGVATANGVYQGYPTTFVVELFGTPVAQKEPVAVQEKKIQPSSSKRVAESVQPQVAGETAEAVPVEVLAESDTFVAVRNTDTPQNISWYQRLLLRSDEFIGLLFQAAIILLLFATGGMVLREYERHHKKHMAYGILLMVILGSMLYIGKLGIFQKTETFAAISQKTFK
ncbi:MAG TPA: CAP domain-containing protein [Candidatus Paceibacterota bacterium]|nr:CAP domain-containing protein [Candidatus Paceibacterota bacterium]